MAKLNDLIVTIGAQTKQFDKALGASMSKMRNFGRSTKRLGKSMTMNLTAPIAALGFTAVKAFDQQAKAIAQNSLKTPRGRRIPVNADTLCVHSDSPGAVQMITSIRKALDGL